MNGNNPYRNHHGVTRLFAMLGLFILALACRGAFAGDLTAISWEDAAGSPTLQVWVSGNPAYEVQSLDGGQRLRLVLAGTVLRDVSDIEGRGAVKGVYPYLSETGTGVNIDFLLSEPGQLKIEAANYGYRVVAQAGAGGAPIASAPPAQPEVAPIAAAPAPPATAPEPAPAPAAVPAPAPAAVPAPAPAAVPAPAPAAVPAAVIAAPKEPATPEQTPAAAKPVEPQNSINEVVYTKLPGDRVQITLRMKSAPPKPAVFTTTNPARLAFDFAGTRVNLGKTAFKVGQGAVTGIDVVEGKNRSRVVVNLTKSAAYVTSADATSFTITVDSPAVSAAGPKPGKVTRFASATRPGKHAIKSIDFRRGPAGDGKIVMALSDSGVGIDIREQAGEIIVDYIDTGITAELQRRLDVTDFGTPVTNIDTYTQGKNIRMVISAKGKYEHLAYQAGEVFTVNVKPIIEKAGEKKKDELGYSGEKLSLNFQNIDVRAALQVIADFTGLNFVTSDTVKGNLTLRLKDVPWDQALDIIAEAKNLSIRKSGNVVRVGPTEEVAAREKMVFEAAKNAVDLEPLVSELIQVNYAKAEDMAKLLKSIKAVDAGGQQNVPFSSVSVQKLETESNTLLSPRGQVTVDARTNTLLIQDIPTKIREVRKLISELDQPVRQVMIETRLVEAVDSFARSIGVRWSHFQAPSAPPTASNTTITCGTLECADGTGGSNLSVNLPAQLGAAAAPAATFAVGLFSKNQNHILALELSALEAEGKGRIISSPRLITGNQKKARIEQGQERTFIAPGTVGGQSFLIKKAVLALEVTPRITPDDRIVMDVLVTKDSFVTGDSGLMDKKEITTQVLLDNGETVVIGGVYSQSETDGTTKVPFLGDLPFLGWAFRTRTNDNNRNELLIFLTPRILSDRLSLK